MSSAFQLLVLCTSIISSGFCMPSSRNLYGPEALIKRGTRNPVSNMPFLQYLINPCEVDGIAGSRSLSQERDSVGQLIKDARMALNFVRDITQSEGSIECNGLHLDSLPVLPAFTESESDYALRSMYKALLYHVAHIYFMESEYQASSRCSRNETSTLIRHYDKLARRVQFVTCTALLAIQDMAPNLDLTDSVLWDVRRIQLESYDDCSSRRTRDCLVLSSTNSLLQKIINKFDDRFSIIPNRLGQNTIV